MASVDQIKARLERESSEAPQVVSEDTAALPTVERDDVETQNQPTLKPTRKVTAAFVGGVLSLVASWVATRYGVEIPETVVAGATGLVATLLGYFVPERNAS